MLFNFKKLYSPVFPSRIGEQVEIGGKSYVMIGFSQGLPLVRSLTTDKVYRLTSKKGDSND